MKKFLVILMVLAMASFLFVGCVPTTPDEEVVEEEVVEEEEEEEEEEVVVVAATVAPVLLTVAGISLTSSATQYINATEAAVVIVTGTAPTYAEVKVYVDDVCAGTADVGVTGTFSVTVAEADLGADGDKVIYATAKEAAIDVSANSTEYAFVLDQVKPTATTLAATADTAAAADSTIVSGVAIVDSFVTGGLGTLTAGTWTISCVADSGVANNIVISDGTTSTSYTVDTLRWFNGVIPDLRFQFLAAGLVAGNVTTVTVTTAIAERATVLFDEEVTYASASAAANFTWLHTTTLGVADAPVETFVNYNNTTLISYFSPFTLTAFDRYGTLRATVNGLVDLAGNTQTTASVVSCTIGAASATSLAP